MTTTANEYSFMPSAGPEDAQVADLLVFNAQGKALVVVHSKDGQKSLPSDKKTGDYSLADTAILLGSKLGLSISKLTPIYGQQKNGTYRVTFLVQGVDASNGLAAALPTGEKTLFTDFFALCAKNEASEHCDYYRAMSSTILAHIFPQFNL